ncbi:MAG TPA: glycosyltransferase family 2 protein [Bacteroidia bacterium]|jgi:undecaprenyl-phosphate 4-deoxy-4-formamido-L-arabinose transferase
MKEIEISIVIPVYNSAAILDELRKRISEALDLSVSYELILVNDGSLDESWKKIISLAHHHPSITGINLRKNSGQDNALLAGLRISKGNYCVIMDDDLQHDPNAILKLYEECKKGFDVCFANFRSKKQNMIKNAGSNANGKFAELLVSKPKGIYLSPFKIINKQTVSEIAKFAGPYPYIDGILLTITQNLSQVDVDHQARLSGKSNYTISKSASVFMKLFTGFSVLPLRLATIAGIIATLVGIGLALKYCYDYFIAENFIEGWTTVVILIIFFGGLILITLGIIGEYIGRMYLTLNNKPQYSISEIIRSRNDE